MHIVIAGGGYAGIMAATRLANAATGCSVTLVDARPAFIERTRLHEWVAGAEPLVRRYGPLLEPLGVAHVQGHITRVEQGVLYFDDGSSLAWDRLLLTLGSRTARPSVVGAERLLTLDRAHDRERLRQHAHGGGAVTIVGGGLTGIELAAELAEATAAKIELISSRPVAGCLSEPAADYLRGRLVAMGVQLREGEAVHQIGNHGLWVWCAGMEASPVMRELGLPVDAQGRVVVDEQLRVPGLHGVWAAGDAAAIEGRPWVRMSCASAMPMGSHAARNLAADVLGRAGRAFQFGFVAQCISLGRRDGIFQLVDPQDRPTATWLCGRSAAWAKELILRMATGVPVAEGRTGLPLYGWRQVA